MKQEEPVIKELLNTLPQVGSVEWIGVRPDRRVPLESVDAVMARPADGLEGDRFNGRPESPRQVTLIQYEHLQAVASLTHQTAVDPGLPRRNVVVKGINLLALKNRRFRIGEAVFEGSGLCHPCSRMEEALGPGGYNAMRGHGGITAKVVEEGRVKLGDPVALLDDSKD